MATEVILSLPDHVYHQAARLAQLMQRDVGEILAETIASALSPLGTSALDLTPVQELADRALVAVADLQMDARQGKRLGHLLDRQQAGTLRAAERSELAALMQVYHECLVRKAQAWREAVRRGLRAPLTS